MISASSDLRSNTLPVRDQGRRPTCLAFALSSAHEHHGSRASHLSVEHLFYHGVARMTSPDPSQGLTFEAATTALAQDGQPLEKHWPYEPVQPDRANWQPPQHAGRIYKRVTRDSGIDLATLFSHLAAGRSIVLGLVITASFLRCQSNGLLPALSPDPVRGGHAVLAVGHGRVGGADAILIRNSWGPGWGDEGHAWLTDAYLNTQLRRAAHLDKA